MLNIKSFALAAAGSGCLSELDPDVGALEERKSDEAGSEVEGTGGIGFGATPFHATNEVLEDRSEEVEH